MEPATAILFDCDGTLIDSVDQVVQSIQYALKKVNEPIKNYDEIVPLFGPGADIILQKLIKDKDKANTAFEYYVDAQRELATDMIVYEGIKDMLRELNRRNIPAGVFTGRHSRDLDIVLSAHGLKNFFDVIVSDDLLRSPKPEPDGIKLASQLLKIPAEKIYYCGDAKGDIESAHKAKARAVAALWDRHVVVPELLSKNPEIICNHPDEILHIFEKSMQVSAEQ